MITPSPLYEPHDGGVVEPDQEEQDWLRNDQGEQDWLRAEQAIFTAAGRDPSAAGAQTPTRNTGWISMACLKCAHLEQLFESKLSNYGEARSAMFHQVSTELAARKRVDMERARNDLEEHQLVCLMRTSESSNPQVAISRGRSLQLQPDKAWS
jgi:hypothetical protein